MSLAPPIGNLGGTVLGVIADPHIPTTQHAARVRTVLDWIRMQGGASLMGLAVLGDGNVNPYAAQRWHEWCRDPMGGNLPQWVREFFVLGNHDADAPPDAAETHENPFGYARSVYPWLFGEREYYRASIDGVSLYALNNISDYLLDSGQSAYPNCNPPGNQFACNPDWSGITNPESAQRQWLDAEIAADTTGWKIAMMHRALWAPFDSDPRKLNRAAREALRIPIEHGLSLVLQGDIHVGSFSGPWYPDEEIVAPGQGAYSLTLAGGYAVRQVDLSVLPPDSVAWASGGTMQSGITHGALIRFQEETAIVQVFECSDADPAGEVVFVRTIARNVRGDS